MKVLIGTNNKAKVKKYGTILEELGIEYCTPKDLNLDIDVDETGSTSQENSEIKAKAYYEATKMPVIVDDCGLLIDKFSPENQPGVFVRRYKGKRLTDEELIEIYSKKIEEVGGDTTGAFVIAITIIDENAKMYTNVLRHERYFISKPCEARTEGYPMNSLIYNKDTQKYLAEEYEGQKMYKGNSFENDYTFIKSVLKK
jgi:non-canonical purine NTP pyrophosphatase (RdgB/HAM1 family)